MVPVSLHVIPSNPAAQLQVLLATQAPFSQGGSQKTENEQLGKVVHSDMTICTNKTWHLVHLKLQLLGIMLNIKYKIAIFIMILV